MRFLAVFITALLGCHHSSADVQCSALFAPKPIEVPVVFNVPSLDPTTLTRYAVTRAFVQNEMGVVRAGKHAGTWMKHELSEAFETVYAGQSPTPLLGNSKVKFGVKDSRYGLVVDPLGGYFRIEDSIAWKHSQQVVYFDWSGQVSSDPAATHFTLNSNFAPYLSGDVIAAFHKLESRFPFMWQELTKEEQTVLLQVTPYITRHNLVAPIIDLALDSRDPAWIRPLEQMLDGWAQVELGADQDWREYKAARVQDVCRHLSHSRTPISLGELATRSVNARIKALRYLDPTRLWPRDLSILIRLAQNTATPEVMKTYMEFAIENGSPEWLPVFDLWIKKMEVSSLEIYAKGPELARLAKTALMKKLVDAMKLSSSETLSSVAVGNFVRAAYLTRDPSVLPFLKFLDQQNEFNFAAPENDALVLEWSKHAKGRQLKENIKQAILVLTEKRPGGF